MQQQQLHYFEWKALLPRSARAHLNMYNGGEGQWEVRKGNERGLLFHSYVFLQRKLRWTLYKRCFLYLLFAERRSMENFSPLSPTPLLTPTANVAR